MNAPTLLLLCASLASSTAWAETTRFCLTGEFDLGARYQGTRPAGGEFYPASWCVVTDEQTERALFSAAGKSNPDMDGDWTVAYLPPDQVRIVNRKTPPDIEFHGTNNLDEARSVRRMDPRRLLAEFVAYPARFAGMSVSQADGRLLRVETVADMPLRGRVPVVWQWQWTDRDRPAAELRVDGAVMLRATGRWETLDERQAQIAWTATAGADPVRVPGDRWPARIAMELVSLADGVHLVRGVRSGFQHMVVETSAGLVVGDAPAGWVELHQVPPSDLVPGLGISELSEGFVDFLKQRFPGRPIAAVALTHAHDDHAGGARAFAAAGATLYAPAPVAAILEKAFNRPEMPNDRQSEAAAPVSVVPVAEPVTIGTAGGRVRILPIGANPHVDAMLGVWAMDRGYFFVSDIHVPQSEDEAPAAERAVTECWFAGWAIASLPDDARVINSHSRVETPVSRLRQYRESAVCRG